MTARNRKSPADARPPFPGSCSGGTQLGFSLLELMIVISIIAVLASLLLPALASAKIKAKIKLAKADVTRLVAGIHQYQAAYSMLPGSKAIEDALPANNGTGDFTFGNVTATGTLLSPNNPRIASYGTPRYQTCNAELIAVLQPAKMAVNQPYAQLAQLRNSRNLVCFESKPAPDISSQGLGPDGVLRDPWGNPYIVTIDYENNGQCMDGFYGGLLKNAGLPSADINGSAIAWSFGPDRLVNPNAGPKDKENRDNVVSWE